MLVFIISQQKRFLLILVRFESEGGGVEGGGKEVEEWEGD